MIYENLYIRFRENKENEEKKLSRCATHKVTPPDIIKAYCVSYRHFWKKTKQNQTTKNPHPSPPNQQLFIPQKALFRVTSVLLERNFLTLANVITQHRRDRSTQGGSLLAQPAAKPGELKAVADLACSEPRNLRYNTCLHPHRSFMWGVQPVKEPEGGATRSSWTSNFSEGLLEISKWISYNFAPFLLSHFW